MTAWKHLRWPVVGGVFATLAIGSAYLWTMPVPSRAEAKPSADTEARPRPTSAPRAPSEGDELVAVMRALAQPAQRAANAAFDVGSCNDKSEGWAAHEECLRHPESVTQQAKSDTPTATIATLPCAKEIEAAYRETIRVNVAYVEDLRSFLTKTPAVKAAMGAATTLRDACKGKLCEKRPSIFDDAYGKEGVNASRLTAKSCVANFLVCQDGSYSCSAARAADFLLQGRLLNKTTGVAYSK